MVVRTLVLTFVFQLSGKVFARLDYLVSHIHNNLLIRFFKCAECPVAFRSQNKIMIHTKVKYSILRPNLTNSAQILPTPPKPYQLRSSLFNCASTLPTSRKLYQHHLNLTNTTKLFRLSNSNFVF